MASKRSKIRKSVHGRSSIHNEEQYSNKEYSDGENITDDDDRKSSNVIQSDDCINKSPTYKCRDEINNEFNKKCNSTMIDDCINKSPTYKCRDENNIEFNKKCNSTQNLIDKPKNSNKSNIIYTFVVMVGAFIVGTLGFNNIYDIKINKIHIEELQKKFPSQSIDMWYEIDTVIDDVLKIEPIHPAVFLFLYDSKNNYDDLINEIAKFATSKLNVDENFITLNELIYKSKSVINDYGYLIYKYKPELETKKVMVIKNINKMSGEVAQALHSFCDEVSPLVDRAVYILTLQVDSFIGSELHTAEKRLYEVWNDLKEDKLVPLITRVTSTVIKIQ